MNNAEKYEKLRNYSVKDFIIDDLFIQYVNNPQPGDISFWESFIVENPEKEKDIEDARKILTLLKFDTFDPSESQIEYMWDKIEEKTIVKKKPTVGSFLLLHRRMAAAIFILFLIVTALFILNGSLNYQSGNGEFKVITLSDGSKVDLGPKSKLVLKRWFKFRSRREVWLEGEAFFSISSVLNNENKKKEFIVHTKDLDIRVLGTTFNVNTKHEKTSVVLNSGKVDVLFKKKQHENISLIPSERLVYSEKGTDIQVDSVNTQSFISWRDQKFIFDNTSVAEIASKIDEYYGFKVRIDDELLSRRKISGTLVVSNPTKLIEVLSTLLSIEIEERGDSLIFKSRN